MKNKYRHISPAEKKRLLAQAKYMLFEQGLTQAQAAINLGVSSNTMNIWVKAAGWRNALNNGDRYLEAKKMKFADSLAAFVAFVQKKDKDNYPIVKALYDKFNRA